MRAILIDDPEHWRQRAEETRQLAQQLDDASTRETLLEIAKSYDELAEITAKRKLSDGG